VKGGKKGEREKKIAAHAKAKREMEKRRGTGKLVQFIKYVKPGMDKADEATSRGSRILVFSPHFLPNLV